MSQSTITSTRSLDAPSAVTSTRSLDSIDPEVVSLVPVPIFAVPAPVMLGTPLPPGVQPVMQLSGTPMPVQQHQQPQPTAVAPEMTQAQKERARKQKKQRHSKSDAAWFKLRFVPRSSEERADAPEEPLPAGAIPRPSYAPRPSFQPPSV